MDWTEKRQCVLCNRGGKLLVCSDDGCPISVHKSCMGCEARLDDVGNFHCPYCLYRRLAAETCRSREKAISAKKALSRFLNEEMRDGLSNKKEQISSRDKSCAGNEKDQVFDDVQNQAICLEKHQRSNSPLPCEETRETFVSEEINVNNCRIMVVYEAKSTPVDACGLDLISHEENGMKTNQLESDVSKRVGVENQTEKQPATSVEEAASDNAVRSFSSIRQITHQKRNHSVAFKENGNSGKEECMKKNAAKTCVSSLCELRSQSRSSKEIDNADSDSRILSKKLLDHPNGPRKGSLEARTDIMSCPEINVSNPGEFKDSSKQLSVIERSTKLLLQNGKRRVRWSDEEEDMLKQGVQKFSLVSRKNLPWKKILEFGRHVFDASRCPSDLKDKWKNMSK